MLQGRTALITGASSGIGKCYARQLAEAGCNLVLIARRVDRLREVAREVEDEFGVRALAFEVDLAKPEACRYLSESLSAQDISIDILVNNAGYGVPGLFNDVDWDSHEQFMQVLVMSVVELTYRLLPGMQERGFGRIINVSSLAGLTPGSKGHTLYGAAKAFLVRFSESLYFENRNLGVRVQCLCPGFTHSEFHDVTGTRELVSKMPAYMWQTADAVVRHSLKALEAAEPLPVVVPGRFNRTADRMMRWLPRRQGYKQMEKRFKKFRKV